MSASAERGTPRRRVGGTQGSRPSIDAPRGASSRWAARAASPLGAVTPRAVALRRRRETRSAPRPRRCAPWGPWASPPRGRGVVLAPPLLVPGDAWAHGVERGLVMLLPTEVTILAASLAVAASVLLVPLVPDRAVLRAAAWRRPVRPPDLGAVPSLLCAGVLGLLIAAGLAGPSDPLSNPLPLAVWIGFWIGFLCLQALVGDLWGALNPWTGLARLGPAAPLRLPGGYGVAIVQFAAFAWVEIASPAPDDPRRLALLAAAWWALNLAGVLLFGARDWLGRAEPFSVLFRLVGWASPRPGRALALPGAALAGAEPLPPSGVAFVLMTLATVSFDGVSHSYAWLAAAGINPLEHPGRTALMPLNTAGLLGAWIALAVLFHGAVAAGRALAAGAPHARAAGRLVLAIVPISLVFHASHYLSALVLDGQWLLRALGDPFGLGWNLAGLADLHVSAAALTNLDSVRVLWAVQGGLVAAGHVAAVVVGHAVAVSLHGGGRAAWLSQAPLSAVMVLYTWFGLWLLSTPSVV